MDPKTRPDRKKRIIALIAAMAVTLGSVAYGLADRYLIDHAEVLALSATITSSSSAATPDSASSDATSTDLSSAISSLSSSAGSTDTTIVTTQATTNTVMSDATNYVSDNIQIHISTVETGTGSNKVTTYVADVTVSDISYLQSAFAKDTFGRNIIEYTSTIAANNDALFAINGDYFGFRSDGVEIRNGILYRNSPARTGAAIYSDGSMKFYDETAVSAEQLLKDGVVQTLSFGPILVQDGVAVTNFGNVKIDSNVGNASSIANNNPRTGIGMISPNHYVFIVVDGRSSGYSRGVSLAEFAQIFKGLGCTQAYNLDGGGSSTMYFMGDVVNNPLGKNKERGVSDILYISE